MLSFTACSKITFNMNSDGFSGNMVEGRMMFKDADSRCSFSFFCMNRSLGVEEGSCSVRGHDNSPPFISNSDPLPGRMGGGVEDWAYAVWQKNTGVFPFFRLPIFVQHFSGQKDKILRYRKTELTIFYIPV